KCLVNVCGFYVDEHNGCVGQMIFYRHVFSKSIHIIVNKLTPHQQMITFFTDNKHLFFIIPMGPKTYIKTTDTQIKQPKIEITPKNRKFVLDNINKRLQLSKPLTKADIIAKHCNIQPLIISAKN